MLALDQIHRSLMKFSREKHVLNQGFELDAAWWRRELGQAGLDVQPPLGGSTTTIYLDRQALFAQASEVFDGTRGPRDFALHVLLWGSGTTRRNNRRRIDSLTASTASEVLSEAFEAASRNPSVAFDAFRSRGRNTFPYLGPAYFTKLMYFAGEGDPDHPSLIVDRRVLMTLSQTELGAGLSAGANYRCETYLRACSVMEELAASARRSGESALSECTPDLVERWAFEQAGLS
ncbi:hypothetical protein [Sinomonas atrocyanea]|uniref:8-oxoguanine DNA glycosylase OGG fold protein n=1 Tax=Sinomonas atrocyanea TaxID=37927 RepID=UPI003D99C444